MAEAASIEGAIAVRGALVAEPFAAVTAVKGLVPSGEPDTTVAAAVGLVPLIEPFVGIAAVVGLVPSSESSTTVAAAVGLVSLSESLVGIAAVVGLVPSSESDTTVAAAVGLVPLVESLADIAAVVGLVLSGESGTTVAAAVGLVPLIESLVGIATVVGLVSTAAKRLLSCIPGLVTAVSRCGPFSFSGDCSPGGLLIVNFQKLRFFLLVRPRLKNRGLVEHTSTMPSAKASRALSSAKKLLSREFLFERPRKA